MKISILIPCHNEEKSIRKCVESCLAQKVKADEILVVNDGSTDRSGEILAEFRDKIRVITIAKATGNKSYAQEYGLRYVTGDIFIASDGDTILDKNFVKRVKIDFRSKKVVAVSGYVKSLPFNWLTSCRALEYIVGQNLHKLAQHYLNFIFVIPGAAGAFRTEHFLKHITFDHDTLTEDLDFTYRFHKKKFKIHYDRKAIVYTQDPSSLGSYINQMRRWYGGGWQNLLKHADIFFENPVKTMELSLVYIEGMVFSILLFVVPILNISFFKYFIGSYFAMLAVFTFYAAIKEKRADILLVSVPYLILVFCNAAIFLEQFVKEVILKKKNLIWFQPERNTL